MTTNEDKQLLTDFINHISETCSENYPDIHVSKTEQRSRRYVIARINNLDNWGPDFDVAVQAFREGTTIRHERDPENDNVFNHTVRIPRGYQVHASHRRRGRSHSLAKRVPTEKPEVSSLLGAVILFLVVAWYLFSQADRVRAIIHSV
jgi:hypothetical protein